MRELADELGYSLATVASWEAGKTVPRDKSLRRVARRLELAYDEMRELRWRELERQERERRRREAAVA